MSKGFTNRRMVFLTIMTLLLFVSITLCWIYYDRTSPPSFTAEQFSATTITESAQKIADQTVAGGAPGVLILIRKGGVEYSVTAGVANKKTQQLMTADQPLRIGSITKVYTANVIIGLAQQGLIELDKPINTYLNAETIDGLPNAAGATVRQLLMHTSGIPDYYDVRSYFTRDWTLPLTLENTLPIAKRGKSSFTPGARFEYSNMGYILLGAIAERVSAKSLGVLFEEHVFGPLNFSETSYNIQFPAENGIHGYGSYFRPWADTYEWWEHSGPDSGIMANASEVAEYLEALTFEIGAFKQVGQQMLKVLIPSEGRQQQGLGLISIPTKAGITLIGHTGDVFGYQTIAFAIPEMDAIFVAQVNCDCVALTTSLIKNIYQAIKYSKTHLGGI